MEERWIESLRKRYADRQSAVPEKLWDDITVAMKGCGVPERGAAKAKAKAGHFFYLAGRVAAAAACIVVAVGIWYFYDNDYSRDISVAEKVSMQEGVAGKGVSDVKDYASAVKDDASVMADDASVVKDGYMAATGTPVRENTAMAGGNDGHVGDVSSIAVEENTVTPEAKEEIMGNKAVPSAKDTDAAKPQRSHVRSGGLTDTGGGLLALGEGKGNGKALSFSVYGAAPAALGSGSGDGRAYMRAGDMQSDAMMDPVYVKSLMSPYANGMGAGAVGAVRTKHRQPVKLGVSVRIGLTDKFGVETGLNYSYLSSDISAGDEFSGYKTEQRLHYVGVPLNLSYNIWRSDYFDIYASGGGAVDFCVSGKADTEGFSGASVTSKSTAHYRDTRPQWSVNASVGAQYKLNGTFSVYAEPGVGYYFDNGSDVMTIYKDKPFNFNLNFGLRVSVR